MKKAAVVLALLVAGPAFAADAPINGADKPIPAYSFAELSVKVEKGDMASWTVYPVPVKKVDKGDGQLYFSGPPGTKYVVSVVVVNFEAKRFDTGQTQVTFAGESPAPVPPDDPDVPDKIDGDGTLNKAVKSAWKDVSDADAAWLPNLRIVYEKAARKNGFVDKAATWGALFEAMLKEAQVQQVAGKLGPVQDAVQAYLKENLPSKGASDTPVTADDKAKAKKAFKNVVTALNRLED